MKEIIVGLILLVISASSIANTNINFEQGYYDFFKNVESVSFKIKSVELNELVKQKLLLDKSDDIHAVIDWDGNKSKIKLKNIKDIPKSSLSRLKEVYQSKASFIIRDNLMDWIKDFELQPQSNPKIFKYEDSTGLLDRSEIIVHEKQSTIVITENIPTGSIKTEFLFITPVWSKKEKVLTRVVRTKLEENKLEETTNHFSYSKLKNKKWMLSKVDITSIQNLNIKSENKIKRKVTESFSFYDYTINFKE